MNKISDIIRIIEAIAPPSFQESYDNAGLITGNADDGLTGALLCLDSTEAVIDEAIAKRCNLVIAHHPIVFSGLKKITGSNYVERTIIKAIKNNISIYAAHTNLDNVHAGVNKVICEKLGLINCKILSPKKSLLKKLVVFCPVNAASKVRDALFQAGAGNIGNYSDCSFNIDGEGTFKAGDNTSPFVGEKDKRHSETEIRIETIFEAHRHIPIVDAILKVHPYEEVAYDIYSLDNTHALAGSGMIGDLQQPVSEKDFLARIKTNFRTGCIRHTYLLEKPVTKVAVCGGSGSFLLAEAIKQGADFFVSADFKYHQFFDADKRIVIADTGHFESEQFTVQLFYDLLKEKIPTFALHFTETSTNPVHYF